MNKPSDYLDEVEDIDFNNVNILDYTDDVTIVGLKLNQGLAARR